MNSPERKTQRFFKSERITKARDFQQCFREGRRVSSEHLVVYFFLKKQGPRRLGAVVTKKTGTAVVRNRWRRRIKECFRLEKEFLPKTLDQVVMVKKTAQGLPPKTLGKEISRLFARTAKA